MSMERRFVTFGGAVSLRTPPNSVQFRTSLIVSDPRRSRFGGRGALLHPSRARVLLDPLPPDAEPRRSAVIMAPPRRILSRGSSLGFCAAASASSELDLAVFIDGRPDQPEEPSSGAILIRERPKENKATTFVFRRIKSTFDLKNVAASYTDKPQMRRAHVEGACTRMQRIPPSGA